jgi:Family of unknown function (DUF6523)
MSNKQLFLVSCILLASISYAFVPSSAAWLTNCRPRAVVNNNMDKPSLSPLVVVSMAGFASADGDNKKKKEMKLKPKQQWDRFASLKKETSVLVAVRVVGQEDWLEVGRVKSKDNASIEAAVAKQRVIIAEHSRRLFPLQVSKDAKVEWAYRQTEPDEQWMVVDKSVLDGSPDGIEKDMGFEGRPDPASGFYCLYNRGRLVDANSPNEGRV